MSISPVVIEIDSPRRAVAVTVSNDGDRPIVLQTESLVWKQVNGIDNNEPTDELLVVPPIVTVPAGGRQVFRVMMRSGAPAPLERTYRLILEDISEALPNAQQTGVAFKLTHSLPIMVAPSGKIVNALRWKPCTPDSTASAAGPSRDGAGQVCVRVHNAGNRRVKVQSMTLSSDGSRQEFALPTGINILVGDAREWRIPLQPGQSGAPRTLQIKTALGETLTAEPGGF